MTNPKDYAIQGATWRVTGLLNGSPFEHEFTSHGSFDPELDAVTLYTSLQLLNGQLTREYTARTEREVIRYKNRYGSTIDAVRSDTVADAHA